MHREKCMTKAQERIRQRDAQQLVDIHHERLAAKAKNTQCPEKLRCIKSHS
jgi:hypothetical protein